MIEIISNWAGELVVALIVTTLIEMLLPENKIKKYVKTLIGIYIVFCIISPFIDESKVLSFEDIEKEFEHYKKELNIGDVKTSNASKDNVSMENLYIEEFKKDVIEQVENMGYEVKKCDVNIEIDATKENAGINKINMIIGKNQSKNNNESTNKIEIDEVQKIEISINEENNEDNNKEKTQETEEALKVKKFLSEYYEISETYVKITQE